ncbi:MAG: molybdenum cofactor guanylyltransferase [Microthrixaceae bacterium]
MNPDTTADTDAEGHAPEGVPDVQRATIDRDAPTGTDSPTGTNPATVGIVLCGGASSRMGRDKAMMGNPPWAHRVAQALAEAGCTRIEFQGGDPALATSTWSYEPDSRPGTGPARALLDALERHRGSTVVAAACDLPHLDAAHVRALVDATGDPTRSSAYSIDGRLNWSLVCIRTALTEVLGAPGDDGTNRSLTSLLAPHTDAVTAADPSAVIDLDTPSSLGSATPE